MEQTIEIKINVNVDEDGNPTSVLIPEEVKWSLSMYIKGYTEALDDLEVFRKKEWRLGRGIAKSFVEKYWKIKNYEGFYRMVEKELEA